MNEIDELLLRAGERFRGQIIEPAAVEMSSFRPGRSRWALPAVVAAGVAAVVAGVVVLPHIASAPQVTTVAGVPSPMPTTGTPDPLDVAPGAGIPADASSAPTTPQPSLPGQRLVTDWRLLAIANGGRRLYFTYGVGGGCDTLDHIQVDQGPAAVRIAPTVADIGRPGQPCSADLAIGRGFVDLAQPLGHRVLLHAPVARGHHAFTR